MNWSHVALLLAGVVASSSMLHETVLKIDRIGVRYWEETGGVPEPDDGDLVDVSILRLKNA
ncbi:MAG: hypothetical protein AAGG01_22950, partial [Planctomycetota bacterium]